MPKLLTRINGEPVGIKVYRTVAPGVSWYPGTGTESGKVNHVFDDELLERYPTPFDFAWADVLDQLNVSSVTG